jgi:uncharacterized membrane protein YfcA
LAIMPLPAAMVLHGVTQMASNGGRAWLWRGHIRWPVVAAYCSGAVAVALILAAIRFVPSKPVALIILGVLPFLGLLLPRRVAPDVTRRSHGFACGLFCTVPLLLAGVSGPILDVCFVRSNLDRKQLIATKAAVQLFGHLLKIAYFGQFLSGPDAVAPAALVLVVGMAFAGTQLSQRVLEAMSDSQFRRWSSALIAAIATVYLIQGLYLLFVDLRGTAVATPLS